MTDSINPAEIASPSLGRQLRVLRELMLLSQEALAERAGVSVGTVRGIERGRIRRPRTETVRMLADALKLSGLDRQAFVTMARLDSAAAMP
jgi:transcriptional regulator with XRE-family HTH domain